MRRHHRFVAGSIVGRRLANDVPEHREVLGDAGLYYRGPDELAMRLQSVLDDGAVAADLKERAMSRATSLFAWDSVTRAYEAWFLQLVRER